MGRRQLRGTVRLESVSISAYGALLGLLIGVLFGAALQRSLADQGITVLGVPWLVLAVVLLASVASACWPLCGPRAARPGSTCSPPSRRTSQLLGTLPVGPDLRRASTSYDLASVRSQSRSGSNLRAAVTCLAYAPTR